MTDLGSNMVLIQGDKGEETAELLKKFDEWTAFWFEWWREWEKTDINLNRIVWTR